MHRRIIAAAMAMSVSLCAAPVVNAAPLGAFPHSASDKAPSGKLISFSVRNDSHSEVVLQDGDQKITLEPGQKMSVKLQEGSDLMVVTGTEHLQAGAVLAKITKTLKDNTLAVS